MKPNLGTADRSVRIVVALAITALYVTDLISGTTAIVLGIVAVLFFVTAVLARCPAYIPLGLSTRRHPRPSV